MRKRILSILLTLCMVICFVPTGVFAEDIAFKDVASAAELKNALADSSVPGIRLAKDIVTDEAFNVTRTVTLDLNGYMLKMTGNDSVIRVEKKNQKIGDLTLIDSRPTTEHRFKADDKNGRWQLDENGDMLVNGGIITSTGTEQRSGGGGVAVSADTKFTMAGGNIVGCDSDKLGSGVYVSFGTFTMTGGKIAGCGNDPGIYLEVWAIMNANGGEVDATVALRENSKITTRDDLAGVTVFRKKVNVFDADSYGVVKYGFFYVPPSNGTTREIVYLANGALYAVQIMSSESLNLAVEPEIPTSNTGSTFLGWYKADGTKWDFTRDVVDDQICVAARWDTAQQFSGVEVGKTYYFDLSGENIPGTVNANLPDTTLHYVPFTYVGTLDGYVLKPASGGVLDSSDKAANTTDSSASYGHAYLHSLFIADHILTTYVSYDMLNAADYIFGNSCTVNDVDYTLRAPTIGNSYASSSFQGIPENNEWDQILFKDTGFIKNLFLSTPSWSQIWTWGQDTNTSGSIIRSVRSGYNQLGGAPTRFDTHVGYRPVLELPTDLAADSLKIVELLTGVFMPGEQQNWINIIVKKGESFKAPSAEGLPRPDAASENALLWWTDGNGAFYRPGDTVPADVSELLLVCDYDVTYLPGAYGAGEPMTESKRHNVALTLRGALFTRTGYTQVGWATVDGGEKVYGLDAVYTQNEALALYPVWNTNQYTITFDTNGGSEIAPIMQDYGTAITAPAAPTREGYTFIGWDREIPETMPAENITLTAQWEINQYTITFDTAGGSEIAPITQDYGSVITAPADPTREGYTFIGWDREIPETMPAENITLTAQWEINQYTITFDTAGGSEIAPITQDYGSVITAPADPTREGYTFIGWDTEIPMTMPAENITVTARWKDSEKPTGEIVIGTNKWREFLNKLTFGLFFKDTQTVTINAADNSGTVFISYLVTDRDLSETELGSLVYRAYDEPFCIDPNGEYIVYAMLVDESLNITYLRSDRITLDNVQPVIGGIEDGKIYCEAQTVTITEKYVDTVTVNGTEVELDESGSFTLAPEDGEQKIVVTDKAGNTAEMTVTVNDGHTFGEWQSNGDGTHTRQCTVDGCNGLETKDCSGGKATCTERAACEVCGKAYGELDPNNHSGLMHIDAKAATKTAEGNIEYWYCEGCNKYYSDAAATKEISKADTVTAKLAEDKKPPKTDDTSNLALWIALLFIGGCAFAALTLKGKKQED